MFFSSNNLKREIACFQSNLENSSNQVEPTHIEAHWGHTLTMCGYIRKRSSRVGGHMMASMICTMALNMATVYKWENHNRKSYYFEWSKCKHRTFPGFQDIFDDVPPGKGQIGQVDLGRRSFSFNSMGKVSLVLNKSQRLSFHLQRDAACPLVFFPSMEDLLKNVFAIANCHLYFRDFETWVYPRIAHRGLVAPSSRWSLRHNSLRSKVNVSEL